jgi:hypothetical protein
MTTESCVADIMAPWVALEEDGSYIVNLDHDFHWHCYARGHEDWASIFVDHESWGEWTVEFYDNDTLVGRCFDNREDATQFVADAMEAHLQ